MDISVTGKHVDVGESLRGHVEKQLALCVGKYFDNPHDATVTFSREAHEFRADITVHVVRGTVMQAQGSATDPYVAFDAALERAAKQLRRHKRKMRDYHKDSRGSADGASKD